MINNEQQKQHNESDHLHHAFLESRSLSDICEVDIKSDNLKTGPIESLFEEIDVYLG